MKNEIYHTLNIVKCECSVNSIDYDATDPQAPGTLISDTADTGKIIRHLQSDLRMSMRIVLLLSILGLPK